MNKVNVIKQNLEFIGKTWMKCIGTFASILSLFFLFWTWDDIRITSTQYKCVIIILLCVLALILAILWTCIFKRTKTIWESPSGKIKVCYSDIMKDGFDKRNKEEKLFVIPVNSCFDTIVDEDISTCSKPLVSPNLLHGRWIKTMVNKGFTIEEIDNKIHNCLESIEWKESWQDEYLKWICGYANAYGGTIYIGTDDDGNVVGIDNARDLLERIPNKITDTMGIIVDVNLLYKGELEYLQIIVDKYPSLISFHGKYYYRSGSTMREITGKELERALLKTQGRTWDGVPLPKLSVSDLKQDAIQLFKDKAVKRGRLTKEEVSVEDTILMDNLHLIDEDGYLIRAAMLAFYKDPEKWVTGSYIKIGYFGKSDSDLVYQDEVHGPLIEQVDKTVDLVYTKYMKALIDYEGVQRIEQFMFHKDAFREILLNAIVHKDYSSCNPIQISVYKDKIYIWNDGEMPPNLDSTDKLFMKHSSKPYNPKLANIFFKSGMIEAWGRGFEKIREACALYDGPLPEYEINEAGIMVLCKACDRYLRLLRDDGQHPEHHPNQNGQDVNKLIIDFCKDPKSVQEIMDEFDFDSRTSFRRKYLNPMLKNGVLKMTIPEKPSSKNQKYFS